MAGNGQKAAIAQRAGVGGEAGQAAERCWRGVLSLSVAAVQGGGESAVGSEGS